MTGESSYFAKTPVIDRRYSNNSDQAGANMLHSVLRLRNAALAIAVVAVLAPSDVVSVELRPGTAAAFDRYVQATQARIDGELKRRGAFLYFEGLPASRRKEVEESLRQGGIYIERLSALDAEGRQIEIPDGLAHH